MIETLPPAGYAADVPRPSIGFSIDVPDHWTVLDLNPQTWDDWLYAFLSQRLAGRAGAKQERGPDASTASRPSSPAPAGGPARRALLDLLRQLHDQKVFMAAILAADVSGELVSASATLAWRKLDTDGEGIPLAGLYQVYASAPVSPGEDLTARRVEIKELPAGGAVKVATKETLRLPPLPEPHPIALTQYLIPVLATDWLAVITTSTPNPPLEPAVEQVADQMAKSLTFTRAQDGH